MDTEQAVQQADREHAPFAPPCCPEQLVDDRLTEFGLLHEAHRRLQQAFDARLEAECGITGAMFEVLLRLGRSPGGNLTMTVLAEQLGMTSGGATRLVDRTAAAGYVERHACPKDRRVQHVGLTPAGAEKLDQAVRVHVADLQRELFDRLGPDDRAALRRIMDTLRTP